MNNVNVIGNDRNRGQFPVQWDRGTSGMVPGYNRVEYGNGVAQGQQAQNQGNNAGVNVIGRGGQTRYLRLRHKSGHRRKRRSIRRRRTARRRY